MKDWLYRADSARPALIYQGQTISYGELKAQIAQTSPPYGKLWPVAGDDPLNVAITLHAAILADKALYVIEESFSNSQISSLLSTALRPGNDSARERIYGVSSSLIDLAQSYESINIQGFHHSIDSSAIRHIRKNHSDPEKERQRGQIAITDSDFLTIPHLLTKPDIIVWGTKNRRDQLQVAYVKKFSGGILLYIEEIRTKRRDLAAVSLRKYPATMNVEKIISTLYPNVHNDGEGTKSIIANIHPDVTTISQNIAEELPTAIPAEAFLLVKTSGSTAKPKFVVLTQKNIIASVTASRQRLGLFPDDCWLLCLPLFHVGGISILYRVLEAGASALITPKFQAELVLAQLYGQKEITHISLVPTMLSQLLELAPPDPPPYLRCVLTGGAALAPGLMQKGMAKGWPIIPTYGMSETASQIATCYPPPADWQAGMVGRPLDGISIRLDKEGRIGIKGPMVMAGYLQGPQPFDAEGYLLSNDQGEILPDGGLLVKGRLDDVLISGGKNVSPLAVEEVLSLCPNIGQVYVTARSDAVWGDFLIAVYDGKISPEEVLEFARAQLPSFQRPREAQRIKEFPQGASGKIDRKKLKLLVF